MAAHNIPYVAQASVGFWADLIKKTERAMSISGPKFMNVLQPCQLGWEYPSSDTVEIGKLAVETCIWPLYEVENGVWRLSYKPKEKKPLVEWLKLQGRFRHLFKPENKELLEELQAEVDQRWQELLKKCSEEVK